MCYRFLTAGLVNRSSKRLKIVYNNCMAEKYLHNFIFTGKELSVDEAREAMSKYLCGDGSVDLNESVNGIVKVCINNPPSRNALNGNVNAKSTFSWLVFRSFLLGL